MRMQGEKILPAGLLKDLIARDSISNYYNTMNRLILCPITRGRLIISDLAEKSCTYGTHDTRHTTHDTRHTTQTHDTRERERQRPRPPHHKHTEDNTQHHPNFIVL